MDYEAFKTECCDLVEKIDKENIFKVNGNFGLQTCQTIDALTHLAVTNSMPHRPIPIPDDLYEDEVIFLMVDHTGQFQSFPTTRFEEEDEE